MRYLSANVIKESVCKMCIEANCILGDDIYNKLKEASLLETSLTAKEILGELIENANIAKEKNMPICQDTGMAVVFVEIGNEIVITDGYIEDAINEGVSNGYETGYLRKSTVHPLTRKNYGDNTPAIIHYKMTKGENLKMTIAPKGFGSENMSRIYMLKPSDGIEGIKKCVIDTVRDAGANPCPPIIVGIGIGGDFEKAALISKEALTRRVGQFSEDAEIKQIELELMNEINNLDIGPGGFGGRTTALAVNINTYPTHIAGLPVAINISCHATRHLEIIL